jgi:hypothetical protein
MSHLLIAIYEMRYGLCTLCRILSVSISDAKLIVLAMQLFTGPQKHPTNQRQVRRLK